MEAPRRQHAASGSPYESRIGFSRAVRPGDAVRTRQCVVSADDADAVVASG